MLNASIFRVGDRVRVVQCIWGFGHVRTPKYIQNHVGEIRRVHGLYHNPESVAHGRSGLPAKMLYSVSFQQSSIWKDYSGPEIDLLYMDVFEHWLEFA
jgi:hypothetical protein